MPLLIGFLLLLIQLDCFPSSKCYHLLQFWVHLPKFFQKNYPGGLKSLEGQWKKWIKRTRKQINF